MKDSKLQKLWEGAQPLQSLKNINLSWSTDLVEIPDLSNATNLEILDLSECTSLVKLPPSIRNLNKLGLLLMDGCTKLEVLPTDVNLESLLYLDLSRCSRLRSFPCIARNILRLYLDGTAMEDEDCLWIENLSRLTELVWKNCPLRDIPSNFHPKHLIQLRMRESKLEKLGRGVGSLESLGTLDLSGSISLKEIDLSKASVSSLNLSNCTSLVRLPSSIQHLDKLIILDMSGCTSLEFLPTNINLVSLYSLCLSGCSRLKSFPQFSTSIQQLNLDNSAIEEIPSWIENISRLTQLSMRGCKKLKIISASIFKLEHLEHADFTDCGITSVSEASVVKTIAELHAEKTGNYTEELVRSFTYSEFHFRECFNLDQDAQELILKSDSIIWSYLVKKYLRISRIELVEVP